MEIHNQQPPDDCSSQHSYMVEKCDDTEAISWFSVKQNFSERKIKTGIGCFMGYPLLEVCV